jgi:D-alanyl-D-alanine carboxypeptidase (penicillin-binding protein 5/6)
MPRVGTRDRRPPSRRVRAALALALLGLLGLAAVAVAWPGATDRLGRSVRADAPAALPVLAAPARDCDLRLQSRTFLVTDARGRALAGLRPDRPRPVGSLTKLMTARVVLERGHLRQTVAVPPLRLGADESRAGLEPGQRLSRLTLLRALLVPSGNDAAETLAAASGRLSFVAAMNRAAERLGRARTDYANPSGMPAPGQHSTARDSIRLARLLMADGRFRGIVRRRSVRIGARRCPVATLCWAARPGWTV